MAYTRELDHASPGVKSDEKTGLKSAASCRLNDNAVPNLRPEQIPIVNIHPYGAHLLPVSLMKIMHQVCYLRYS